MLLCPTSVQLIDTKKGIQMSINTLYKGFYDYKVDCKDTPSSLPYNY